MGEVFKYGLDALSNVRKNVKAAANLTEGTLFGLDSDGEAIAANAATGVKAVGVVANGSTSTWGAAIEFSKTSTLRTGDYTDLNKFAILDVTEATYSNAEIGTKLYLGASGAYTTTQNTTIGQLDQHVGYVCSRSSVLIDLTLDTTGTTVAASQFDVVEHAADGAIAVNGTALCTTDGVSALNMTLAAPSPQAYVRIQLKTDGGTDLIVTTASGVTFDGTNNTATFADAADELVLGYKSATEWIIVENVGSVALSAV